MQSGHHWRGESEQREQMKAWLSENGVEAESLGKKDVAKLIDDTDGQVEEALVLFTFVSNSTRFSLYLLQTSSTTICPKTIVPTL